MVSPQRTPTPLTSGSFSETSTDHEVADHGEDALDWLAKRAQEQSHYDVILMDLEIPIMDGITCVGRIREDEAVDDPLQRKFGSDKHLVIALTGNARSEQVEQARASGMDDGEWRTSI
jgi:CheY-like chemotaxis protein